MNQQNINCGHLSGAFGGAINELLMVDATNGNISAKYEYGPFGEVFCSVGDMAKVNPFQFSTKYTDNETDLLYYGYRYYSPALGRWLSRDPIEERGGLNLYGFVNNDPLNYVDRFGNNPLRLRYNNIRNYLEIGDEDMAVDELYLFYLNIASYGGLLEPLAGKLLNNWLRGAPQNPFYVHDHVKNALLDESHGESRNSPRDQLGMTLCADLGNKKCGGSGKLLAKKISLTASKGEYYHSFGNFTITFTGEYKCDNNSRCIFSGNWYLYDIYDWHDGLDAKVLDMAIPDSWALLLETYERPNHVKAKSFEVKGKWTGKVKIDCSCNLSSFSSKDR